MRIQRMQVLQDQKARKATCLQGSLFNESLVLATESRPVEKLFDGSLFQKLTILN